MTVQAGIETVTDLEVLVGEFEEQACEHQQHEARQGISHDSGPAKFYARGLCPRCGFFGEVRPVCSAYAATARTSTPMRCSDCWHIGPAKEMVQVLAPINSSAR